MTDFTKSESSFKLINRMHFFIESETSFTMNLNPDSANRMVPKVKSLHQLQYLPFQSADSSIAARDNDCKLNIIQAGNVEENWL